MANESVWDVKIVSLATDSMTTLAYVGQWESFSFADSVNDFGGGSILFDMDTPWLDDFYSENSNKYPWELNCGIQFVRDGVLAYTLICEEAEIRYVGDRRMVSLGGRGLAAALTWAIVLPEGFDESLSDPDDPDNVLYMSRGFGSVGSQADIDAGNYSVDSPQHKAYGAGAFVHLFEECDTGNATTWANITVANSNRTNAVTWPLSLSQYLTRTHDSNNINFGTTGTYPEAEVTWLFEIGSGMSMYDALLECCQLTANSQWNISPDGKIHIAKQVGTDKSATILLSVPQAQNSTNKLNNSDTRSHLFASNGYLFEKQTDSTSIARFGRREGFVDADQSEGQLVSDIAKHTLEEVKDELDQFTFTYFETLGSKAFIDFTVSDTVNIEYENGVINARQITGLGASVTADGTNIELVVGDIVENAIAVLNKKDTNNQYTDQITTTYPGWGSGHPNHMTELRKTAAPTIVSVTPKREGLIRSVKIAFKTPGWVGTLSAMNSKITSFEAEVYLVSDATVKHAATKALDATTVNQEIVVTGMGEKGSSYRARVRAVGKGGPMSEWAISDAFNLSDSGEGGASDPYKPGQVSGVTLFPMLNSILVKFTDFTGSTNPTVAGARGKYEIEISNATGGSANFGSGNTWTRTLGGNTAGDSSTAARKFVVPDGSGFICTGLYSASGGRTHYVRVRALNWDGTGGDWSATASTSLDTDDEAQVGVHIGEDTITASAIKAGTITVTEIAAGTITAEKMNADQVITSSIRMPQPANATNASQLADGTSGNEIKFSVDKDGNMWWGNFTSYQNAIDRTIASGSIDNDYVWTRFAGDGSDYRIGTPNNYVRFSSNPGLFSKNLYLEGTANIRGNLVVETGQSGALKAGNTTLSETRLSFGTGPYLSIDHALGTYFGGNSIAIKWGGTSGSDAYGYIAGGIFGGVGSAGMIAMGMGTSSYHYSSATQSGIYASGDANIHIRSASRFMKIEAEGSNSYIQLSADGGIYIENITPNVSTWQRLYNSGGNLYWDGSILGMDIAGLATNDSPGNPAFTYIPWSYSTAGTEKKMSVAALAQELLSTGQFLDPDVGGTIDGHLVVGTGYDLKITNGYLRGGSTLTLRHSSTSSQTNFWLTSDYNYSYRSLLPAISSTYRLGNYDRRWNLFYVNDIYHYGDINDVSDQSLKTDIADESKGLAFINSLRPRTYKWKEVSKDDGSGDMRAGVRTHHGFVAQEVETVLASDAANDAIWINMHNPAQEEIRTEDGDIEQEASEESYLQGLRLTEFIGPIVKAIQELSARVEALEG